MRHVFLILLAVLLFSSGATALTVSSDAPCNIFLAGKGIEFKVTGAQGDIRYELLDYYGTRIAEGKVPAAEPAVISIPAQKPCWYELICTDQKGSSTTSLGVVIDRGDTPLPEEGRIGVVACTAWLIKSEAYRKPIAQMTRRIGLSWVREPIAWEGTEPEPGKFDWNIYQTVDDLFHAEGVFINQGWTSVPAWSHPGNGGLPYPEDLRTLYRYLKTAAEHFKKEALVWDVLNEVELSWPLLSDTCAPMQKVSYLGIKAGNPRARVLSASLTHVSSQAVCDWGVAAFAWGLYESGIGDYFDIFNHHTYLPTWTYPDSVESHRAVMRRFGIPDKAFWVTEAGLGMAGVDGPAEHLMNKGTEKMQCRLAAMSAAMSLVAGNEKYFWFVLPDYMEGTATFSMLRPDITPNPSLLALSASSNLIGVSEYIGEYNADGGKSVAHLFSTPKGNVLVAWSDREMELSIPTEKSSFKVADIFGAERRVAAKDGKVTVKLSAEAVYVLDPGKTLLSKVKRAPKVKIAPEKKPSTVVLAGRGDLPTDRNYNAYKLKAGGMGVAGEPFTYTVDVYQFDEKRGAEGTIELTAPRGWIVEEPKRTLKLAPMDKQTVVFKITPVPSFLGVQRIVVDGTFNGKPTAPAAAFMKYEINGYQF